MRNLGKLDDNKKLEDFFAADQIDSIIKKVVEYLNNGVVIARAVTPRDDNPYLPGVMIHNGEATDGEWVWGLATGPVVEARKILPEIDFINHVLEVKVPPSELSDEVIAEALEVSRQQ